MSDFRATSHGRGAPSTRRSGKIRCGDVVACSERISMATVKAIWADTGASSARSTSTRSNRTDTGRSNGRGTTSSTDNSARTSLSKDYPTTRYASAINTGSATLFEVTQPRVTCYRLGIRMNEPRMPAMLTSSGRPGFYLRVLEPGDVGAGDAIVKVGQAAERMTVAEINALLYSSDHPRDQLERALRIDALSPGWRASFDALMHTQTDAGSGNAGLMPGAAAYPAVPGFRPLAVAVMDHESVDVVSLTLRSTDGRPLNAALPGQYVVLRLRPTADRPLFRSYSLSGAPSTERYRISVKIEPHGAAGAYLREHVREGDVVDVSAPRGSFILQSGERPVVLLSAGIGATPVLAMLHALASAHSTRQVFWLHGARDRDHHAFAAEVRRLMLAVPSGRTYICYSRPGSHDKVAEDFDAAGHLSPSAFDTVGIPRDADVYLRGLVPTRRMRPIYPMLSPKGSASNIQAGSAIKRETFLEKLDVLDTGADKCVPLLIEQMLF